MVRVEVCPAHPVPVVHLPVNGVTTCETGAWHRQGLGECDGALAIGGKGSRIDHPPGWIRARSHTTGHAGQEVEEQELRDHSACAWCGCERPLLKGGRGSIPQMQQHLMRSQGTPKWRSIGADLPKPAGECFCTAFI